MDQPDSPPSSSPPSAPSRRDNLRDLGIGAALLAVLFIGIAVYFVLRLQSVQSPIAGQSVDAQTNANSPSAGYCQRSAPYPMRPEFDRAVSLVLQRLMDRPGQNWQLMGAKLATIRNCLNITYAPSAADMAGAEGQFRFSLDSSPNDLTILVHPNYVSKSDLYTAVVLSHEMVHAARFASGQSIQAVTSSDACFEEEAQAFFGQDMFTSALNPGERSQITQESFFARQSGTTNEALELVSQWDQVLARPEVNYLDKLRGWVRSQPGYQAQCRRS